MRADYHRIPPYAPGVPIAARECPETFNDRNAMLEAAGPELSISTGKLRV